MTNLLKGLETLKVEMAEWRHTFHKYPEIAYKEFKTSDFIAQKLESAGLKIHRGLAGTGVVATLKNGSGSKCIGLRADMDALPIAEKNTFSHSSTIPGMMHACGHDGHSAMLMGAAIYLSENRNFDGTIHFVFQPAEENEAGARRMIDDGFLELFPMDEIYGMHNYPGLPEGKFKIKDGCFLAGRDHFEIQVIGKGTHAAFPHSGVDPVFVASHIISTIQGIVSRKLDPLDNVVISITQVHGGDALNVIPELVTLKGSVRTLRTSSRELVINQMEQVIKGICISFGAEYKFNYTVGYPPLVNSTEATKKSIQAATNLVGGKNVDENAIPIMGSEDFAFYLEKKPGAYILIGNGEGEVGGCMVHNPYYDFNDRILPLGASYWVSLAHTALGA